VNPRRNLRHRIAAEKLEHRLTHRGPYVYFPRAAALRNLVTIQAGLIRRRHEIQLQRNLSLVGRVRPVQEQRAEGVEVPPESMRRRHVEAAMQHPADDVEIRDRDLPEQREPLERRFPLERVVHQRQRDAPWLADRHVAARKRQRRNVAMRVNSA
jgi:hypothetical protein